MHNDRIRELRELTKLVVRYEKTTRSESVVVRSNCVTLVKWSGVDAERKVVWVTGGEEEIEAESVEKVVEEVGTYPVCLNEGTNQSTRNAQ